MKATEIAGIAILTLGVMFATARCVAAQTTNPQSTSSAPPKVKAIVEGHLEADDLIRVEVENLDESAPARL